MKALLRKTLEWVDIETDYVFDDQYNTATKRIMDSDIIRLYEDIRILNPEMCRCSYCGKCFLTIAEYENHVKEEKEKAGKTCKGCFWSRIHEKKEVLDEKVVDGAELTKGTVAHVGEEGECITITTTKIHYKHTCMHMEDYKCCEHEEHGQHEPKTFEKAYFVKHPYGSLFNEFTIGILGIRKIPKTGLITGSETVKGIGRTRTFKFMLDWQTLEWKLKIPRDKEELNGTAIVSKNLFYTRLVPSVDISNENRFVLEIFAKMVEDNVRSAKWYNETVTDDRLYTQPDGTILKSVEIDGKTVERPKPIDTSGWTFEEE